MTSGAGRALCSWSTTRKPWVVSLSLSIRRLSFQSFSSTQNLRNPANDPLPKRNNAQQCFSEGWFISFMRAFLWCCSLLDNQSLQHQSSQSCAISLPWLLHPSLPHQCSPNLGLTTGRQFTKDRQCHLRVYDVPWRQKVPDGLPTV